MYIFLKIDGGVMKQIRFSLHKSIVRYCHYIVSQSLIFASIINTPLVHTIFYVKFRSVSSQELQKLALAFLTQSFINPFYNYACANFQITACKPTNELQPLQPRP